MSDQEMRREAQTPELCPQPVLASKRRYRADEAESYLLAVHGMKVARATLNKKRSTGGGPKFHKTLSGGVLYDRTDLDAWALVQLGEPVANTSEADNRKPEGPSDE